MIIELLSVATVIDDQTFLTYPLYQNGSYDETSPVHLDRCIKSWFDALDESDRFIVEHLLDIKKEKEKRIYY